MTHSLVSINLSGTVETLQKWLEEGRVDASSLVCRQGETSWVAITAHAELASLFPAPAGPGLAPPRRQSRFVEKQGWLWLNACVSYVIYSLLTAFL